MSTLSTPLLSRFLWNTGDILLRAELILSLKTNRGTWKERDFLVDPGSEITTMPAFEAKKLGIAMPLQASLNVRHHPTGLEIRSGYLRCRVVGMDQTEYVVPCFFLGDPNTPIRPSGLSMSSPRKLLGLAGVVDKLRIIFDGTPGPGAAYGHIIIEKI